MQTKFFEMHKDDHQLVKGIHAKLDETNELETMPTGNQWGARMGAFKELVEHHIQDTNGILKSVQKWSMTWPHKNSVGRQ